MADALVSAALLGRLAFFLAMRRHSPSSSCPGKKKRGRNLDSQGLVAQCRVSGASSARDEGDQGGGIAISDVAAAGLRLSARDGDGGFTQLRVERLIVAAHLATLLVKLKAVSSGIKAADLVVKAIKAAHGVMLLLNAQRSGGSSLILSPDGIVVGIRAAKVVIKGLKMSHKALKSRGFHRGVGFGGRFKKVASGIKASFGALDLVRGSKGILSEVMVAHDRVAAANWTVILKCYEASRGALSTVEALASLKVGFVAAFGKGLLGVKGAVGGMGVMIKAWVVSKELYVLLIKGVGLSHGAREVFNIIAEKRHEARAFSGTTKVLTVADSVRFTSREAVPSIACGSEHTTLRKAATLASVTMAPLNPFSCYDTGKAGWWAQQTSRSELCLLFSVQGLGRQL
ncbi:hypothetical protein SELMODRAFT_447756 [Selaginella moellendorffii]|uniref:DUF3475 domain-containing protein n=1 Tax=Selaginella moellendorffii TaxID=88036 RepID=D8T221_SELML|nr:hypothetical protein SELMODRAFT_447756 [Selaginella moellendorffii]